jgi:hypothetical protein
MVGIMKSSASYIASSLQILFLLIFAATSAAVDSRASAQVAVNQARTSPSTPGKATASEPTIDKRQFNLFDPTPREYLRDLSPDRPDTTESPIVDAGGFHIEASFFDYGRNDDGGVEEEVFTHGAHNFKVGLHNPICSSSWTLTTEVRLNLVPSGSIRAH